MDWEIVQQIDAPVEAVDATLVDAAFLATMAELPKLGSADVLSQSRDGDVVRQQVRYLFQAELSGAVRRVVDPEQLSWVEDSTHDLDAHRARYDIRPDHYANLLEGGYDAVLAPSGSTTTRTLQGSLRVRVPLVGGKVERVIVDGLRENAAAQAALIGSWLSRG
jgi:hypothetical protein